jgi:hypothetical protein
MCHRLCPRRESLFLSSSRASIFNWTYPNGSNTRLKAYRLLLRPFRQRDAARSRRSLFLRRPAVMAPSQKGAASRLAASRPSRRQRNPIVPIARRLQVSSASGLGLRGARLGVASPCLDCILLLGNCCLRQNSNVFEAPFFRKPRPADDLQDRLERCIRCQRSRARWPSSS